MAAAAGLCLLGPPADAQSYTVLHPFKEPRQYPSGLIQASDGNIYGTTESGGANSLGSVFRITPTGELTTLHSFVGCDAARPQAGLVQGRDGAFYGTTFQGGTSDYGTVFRMTPAGALTRLHSFDGVADGVWPHASLVQGADGNFYGTTESGGTSIQGTVFKMTPEGALTTLHSFAGNEGSRPQAALVQGTDGNFYGTTDSGGTGSGGTVFKMTPEGALTTLYAFSFSNGGHSPYAGLVQGTDGNFYGTTSSGGTGGYGTVFKITPAGALTTLHLFAVNEGSVPQAALVQGTDGNFYGTTLSGGTENIGTVFKVTPAGELTALHSFGGSDGQWPYAGLVQGIDGSFYGTTSVGGPGGNGTVFEITPAGTLTTLYAFAFSSDGASPYGGLAQEADGNFYGTTSKGGTGNNGTFFMVTPSGELTTLHSFSGSDGRSPYGTLVQGTDGNFYGATYEGGSSGIGTLFKITSAGALTTLHSFSGTDGASPYSGVVQGTDGNLYGTTWSGGAGVYYGTVFKSTSAGTLTTLYSFSGSDGAYPYASLVQGTDGNFYGTTSYGGPGGFGTVFVITPGGTLTTLYSFTGSGDGASPYAGLVQGTDGNFYGTTNWGGTGGNGTAFKVTPAGALTTLYSFTGSGDGASPYAGLVQGTDGNFYGTTLGGGTGGNGTIFKMTPAGALTTLHSIAPSSAMDPSSEGKGTYGGLVEGVDGLFYGTAYAGGSSGGGVVFRLTPGPGPGPAPTVTGVSPAGGPVLGGNAATVTGSEFQPGATVSFDGMSSAGVSYLSATTISALAPSHAAGAVTVTVTNPDLQAGSLPSAYTYACSSTPTAPTALNGGPHCDGATISLSTPTVLEATYSWSGPNGFTSALQNPTIPAPTTSADGTYSVAVTVAGCTSMPGTTTVVVNPIPAAPTASNTGPYTVGATIELTASTVSGAVYYWTGPGNSFVSNGQNPTIPFATAANGGTYSVTVWVAGCQSPPATTTVVINPVRTEAWAYTVLHPFGPSQQIPNALVQVSDGNFYGTTVQGGTSNLGTVFRITPAGALTTLYSFAGTDGSSPAGLVQGTDGNFYGTTLYGGTSNYGTVFRITPTGALTTLHLFVEGDGANPSAALVQGADRSFYGTTSLGGSSNGGTVFRITPLGALTTLYSFAWSDGGSPYAGLLQGTDGNFYGTTSSGGAIGSGTVFRMTPAGALTTLYSFAGSDGKSPRAALVQGIDGDFYGTTFYGGTAYSSDTSGLGTVFKLTSAGTLTTLHSFAGNDGAGPWAGLVEGTDGNFYGTTTITTTGSGAGTVFRITPAGTLTTLHSFSGSDGLYLQATLVQGVDGNFYGTTAYGSPVGTVFRITPPGTLTTLYSFAGSDGTYPQAGLVQGTDGNFYGTTSRGGPSDDGTVFKVTPAGTLTTLYSFTGSDGMLPYAGLVQGTDGDFYGTTAWGSGLGTVFKITPTGTLTRLHSFTRSDGWQPYAGLVQGTDGDFYGTTVYGGNSALLNPEGPPVTYGTVFKITPAGALTTLHLFTGSDGANPQATLVLGTDGNFYGTTVHGGPFLPNDIHGIGTVFKITPAGTVTTLHLFAGSDGAYPQAGLVQGADGSFYGTTSSGGSNSEGTVFKITPAGEFTLLHSFLGTDGVNPINGLVQGTDGNFYGTTSNFTAGYDTVFRITPAGVLTMLHSFRGSDGSYPVGSLVQGTDGNLYGATYFGGSLGGGVLFRLTPPPGPAPAVTGVLPAVGPLLGGTIVTITGADFQPGATVSFDGAAATGVTYFSATTIYALAPAHAAGVVTVTVTNPDLRAGNLGLAYTYICSPATPMVTAPSTVGAGSPNRTATVPTNAGSTYSWAIENGTITSGQGTSEITFTAGTAGTPLTLSVIETGGPGCMSAPGTATVTVAPAGSAVLFYTLPPCRVLDTRNPTGPLGAPSLQLDATRTFDLSASPCGIPAGAVAISVNMTVTNVGAVGALVVLPDNVPSNTYAICFRAGFTRANNAIVSLSKASPTFSVFNDSAAPLDFIVDVNGYFR